MRSSRVEASAAMVAVNVVPSYELGSEAEYEMNVAVAAPKPANGAYTTPMEPESLQPQAVEECAPEPQEDVASNWVVFAIGDDKTKILKREDAAVSSNFAGFFSRKKLEMGKSGLIVVGVHGSSQSMQASSTLVRKQSSGGHRLSKNRNLMYLLVALVTWNINPGSCYLRHLPLPVDGIPTRVATAASWTQCLQHGKFVSPSWCETMWWQKGPRRIVPLVFFHVRKASGSLIRKYLVHAAEAMKLPTWMVCYGAAMPCENNRLPTDKRYAVYGGHLNHEDAVNVVGFNSRGRIQLNPPAVVQSGISPFDCLVMLRPTVSRVVSCWKYRYGGQDGRPMPGFKPAHELSPAEWERLLPTAFSVYHEGCNDELVRAFGDNTNEASVNTWLVDDQDPLTSCRAAAELDTLLWRISKCTVLIQGQCPGNRILAGHAIPWAKESFNESFCEDQVNPGRIISRSLEPGAEETILRQNRLDEYIFQFGLALHHEQLRNATSS